MARELVVRLIGDDQSLRRAFTRSSSSAKGFERDISRASRGVLVGTGAFRSLGRSIAFASAAFVGTAGIATAIRGSIGAAETSAKAHASLEVALRKLGASARQGLPAVDAWAKEQAKFGVSANIALTGLSRLVQLTGSTKKAMEGYTAALAISKATGRDFNAVSLAVAKAMNGQTTALARYIGKIPKGISDTELLARVMAKFGGQARANTVGTDRLRAELSNLGVVLGNVLLPTVEKIATGLADWLSKTKNQESVQRDLTGAVRAGTAVIDGFAKVTETADKVTGSFKNTIELLGAAFIGLKVAKVAAELGLLASAERAVATSAVVSNISAYTAGVGATGAAAKTSAVEVSALSLALRRLALIGVITTVVEVVIHRKSIDDFGKKIVGAFTHAQQGAVADALAKTEAKIANVIPGVHVDWRSLTKAIDDQTKSDPPVLSPTFKVNPKIQDVSTLSFKQQFPEGFKKALHDVLAAAGAGPVAAPKAGLPASVRNTFFDNAIARILLRGGLGTIRQQIAALQQADALLAVRLKVTKDATRKLNLEDQLLQNAAQLKGLQAQQAADALQARQDAAQKVIDALQFGVTKAQATASFKDDIAALLALQAGVKREIAVQGRTLDLQQQLFDVDQQIAQARKDQAQARITALSGRQFRELGLTATGEERTPGVANLKKRLAQITANISGTTLDTPKLRTELARFRKVLSEGLVPKDVRAKIQQMIDDIAAKLKDGPRQLTKFAHVNANAVLAGLGLTADQQRALRARIAQVGPGGTVPGRRSLAFAGAGAGPPIVLHAPIYLDGELVSRNTTKHQQKASQRRTTSRRGPYAGHN